MFNDVHAAVVVRVAAASATLLLATQCMPAPSGDVAIASLSTFTQSLLGHRRNAARLPPFPPESIESRAGGLWLLRPSASTARCGAAIISMTRCGCGDGEQGCTDCGAVQSCVASIIAGMRQQGIRPGAAELIRIDAFEASDAGAAAHQPVTGMRLRFEQRVQDAGGGAAIYKAQVVLLPAQGVTRVAMLVTVDRGGSNECFDAANLVFSPRAEAPCE